MSTLPPQRPVRSATRPPDGSEKPPRRAWVRWVIYALVAAALGGIVALAVTAKAPTSTPSISYSSFLHDVSSSTVRSVEIDQSSGKIDGQLTNSTAFTTQGPPGGPPEADIRLLDEHGVERSYVVSSSSDIWPGVITIAVLVLLGGMAVVWFSRRSQGPTTSMDKWSRSGAKVHTVERPSATFADVAGYQGVKEEIGEVVEFLRNPSRFEGIGARIPKGVLLVGPPGTGKTLVAKAVAGEAGVPFISITGSEFMEMFVGVGAARVRDLFNTARESKPSIVFVDEIDAIGRKRGAGLGGGHDEREQTLNQLLAAMDGFEQAEGIVVLAATNRPDVLDPALLRAGRFDRQVVIPLPTAEERLAILKVHCRNKRLDPQVDLATLARGTAGMSGADLANLLNEAALLAVRRGRGTITGDDLEAARDRVLLGMPRTSLVLAPEEKRLVAYHEAGHAVLAEVLPHSDPVHKVTILPTGMSLGATQQMPREERQLEQQPFLEDALAVRLGGRAAEQLVFGTASTGAHDDLTSATELASRMVREWGMSPRIGLMAWGPRGPVFLGEELVHTRSYSDQTARVIDEEVSRILEEQSQRSGDILAGHRASLDAVAAALVAKETLEGAEVERIVAETERPAPRQAGRGLVPVVPCSRRTGT